MVLVVEAMEKQSTLLIGTGNQGKFREISDLLAGVPFQLISLSDTPTADPPYEHGDTYEANALIKARYYATLFAAMTLADDSGLEVDALNGAPGVVSARYAGEGATDGDRRDLILGQMISVSAQRRSARFVCAIAVVDHTGQQIFEARGICNGTIGRETRGDSGFGYDPIFIPDGYDSTFAELSAVEKNKISHRARALRPVRDFLLKEFR